MDTRIMFKNKYGRLILDRVGDYQDVGTISSKDLDTSLFFSIEDAEKIALITDNHSIQLSVTSERNKMFVVHHWSPSKAAPCRIVKLEFTSDVKPEEEIALAAKRSSKPF